MDKNITDILGATISVIMGLCFAIFHKQLAHKTAEFYYKFLHIHFSEKGYQIGFLAIGIIFVIIGCLSLFHIIRFR